MNLLSAATFTKPQGTNFSSPAEVPSVVLANSLCKITSILQRLGPYIKLQRYWDLWEHGAEQSHYHKGQIDFHGLFEIVESPRNLLREMPGDVGVFIGIAANDNSWYLRFYMDWDEDGFYLLGRFDITLPNGLAGRFREEVVKDLAVELKEQEARDYYASIS